MKCQHGEERNCWVCKIRKLISKYRLGYWKSWTVYSPEYKYFIIGYRQLYIVAPIQMPFLHPSLGGLKVGRRHPYPPLPTQCNSFCFFLLFFNVNLRITHVYTPQTFVYTPQFQISRNNPDATFFICWRTRVKRGCGLDNGQLTWFERRRRFINKVLEGN